MIICGAGGFAKQLVEIFYQHGTTENLFFFDNITTEAPGTLFGFKVLRSEEEVINIFQTQDNRYCLGVSNPAIRRQMVMLFDKLRGELTTVISKHAFIASNARTIGQGATILTSAIVESNALIGKGVLINTGSSIHHDCEIGDFTEIAPGARILGGAVVKGDAFIGANATILPKIKVAEQAVVGAGAVVNKDVEKGCTVIGVPAKLIQR